MEQEVENVSHASSPKPSGEHSQDVILESLANSMEDAPAADSVLEEPPPTDSVLEVPQPTDSVLEEPQPTDSVIAVPQPTDSVIEEPPTDGVAEDLRPDSAMEEPLAEGRRDDLVVVEEPPTVLQPCEAGHEMYNSPVIDSLVEEEVYQMDDLELVDPLPPPATVEVPGDSQTIGSPADVGALLAGEEVPQMNDFVDVPEVHEMDGSLLTSSPAVAGSLEVLEIGNSQLLGPSSVAGGEVLEMDDSEFNSSPPDGDSRHVGLPPPAGAENHEMDDSPLDGSPPAAISSPAVDSSPTFVSDDKELKDREVTEVEEEEEGTKGEKEAEAETLGSTRRKRKRGRSGRGQTRASAKKKEDEDVCFICFDGGNLVLCDRRGCPKAYHPSCVNRDEAFFQSKGRWNCGWHICSNCEKAAQYMCYTCTFSLCKGCIKEAVFLRVRGTKGFCETCMRTVMAIEQNEHENKEMAAVNFDDRSSWEYLFKDYWLDLKGKHALTLDELTQAKDSSKGAGTSARNEGDSDELYDANVDPGVSSDSSLGHVEISKSSRKKKKKQSRSASTDKGLVGAIKTVDSGGTSLPEGTEWASKELLELVSHMKGGDTSVLTQYDVQALLLEYIKKNKLRDPRRKSQIICDPRLANLFGKARVGHFEMLKLLESHFLIKDEPTEADDGQEGITDTEAILVEAGDNTSGLTKADKRRKKGKRVEDTASQANLDEYAAIDVHNIQLIYLRRNLMEDMLEDVEAFQHKVVGTFVRIRISGTGQKQDMYRLVQVVGIGKAAEAYKTSKRTTDVTLEILNLNKTESISIDTISNQEFTEEECKRLRQSIKCGFISRLTVGEVREKARALQAVRVNDWLETEKLRLSHLRDRASETGRRKELRECVEKLQLLNTPEERSRRLQELPDVHTDPNMDPSHESDEEEPDNKKQDSFLKPRDSGYGRRGRDPISPSTRKTSTIWEQSRNTSGVNWDKSDSFASVSERTSESSWNQAKDVSHTNNWEQPLKNQATVSSQPVMKPEPQSTSSATSSNISETEKMWHYQDPAGKIQGPFSMTQLRKWSTTGYFPVDLRIWKTTEKQEESLLLTDALVGKFQKEPPQWDTQNNNAMSDNRADNWKWGGTQHGSAAPKAEVKGGQAENLSQSWDLSTSSTNSAWSGQSQSPKVKSKPTYQGREDRGGNNWGKKDFVSPPSPTPPNPSSGGWPQVQTASSGWGPLGGNATQQGHNVVPPTPTPTTPSSGGWPQTQTTRSSGGGPMGGNAAQQSHIAVPPSPTPPAPSGGGWPQTQTTSSGGGPMGSNAAQQSHIAVPPSPTPPTPSGGGWPQVQTRSSGWGPMGGNAAQQSHNAVPPSPTPTTASSGGWSQNQTTSSGWGPMGGNAAQQSHNAVPPSPTPTTASGGGWSQNQTTSSGWGPMGGNAAQQSHNAVPPSPTPPNTSSGGWPQVQTTSSGWGPMGSNPAQRAPNIVADSNKIAAGWGHPSPILMPEGGNYSLNPPTPTPLSSTGGWGNSPNQGGNNGSQQSLVTVNESSKTTRWPQQAPNTDSPNSAPVLKGGQLTSTGSPKGPYASPAVNQGSSLTPGFEPHGCTLASAPTEERGSLNTTAIVAGGWGPSLSQNTASTPSGNWNSPSFNQATGWGATPEKSNNGCGPPEGNNSNAVWGAMTQGHANTGCEAATQGKGNANMEWEVATQGNGNANTGWGAATQGNVNTGLEAATQGNVNTGRGAPTQGNANGGWGPPGGQNSNPSWGTTNTGSGRPFGRGNTNVGHGAVPRGATKNRWGPMENQGSWGGNQNYNDSQGGDFTHGGGRHAWNRSGSGLGPSGPPNRGQRPCMFYESGHCKKGASCSHSHS